MEIARRVAAVIVGIFILILVILAARWVGERIRERFFVPKPVVITETPTLEPTPSLLEDQQRAATYSAIPKTGPAETGLLLIGFGLFSGLSTLALAHRKI